MCFIRNVLLYLWECELCYKFISSCNDIYRSCIFETLFKHSQSLFNLLSADIGRVIPDP